MKNTIEKVTSLGEPEGLGWTCLGPILREDCWQGTGWVYCLKGQFAVFNEAGQDMEFKGFIEKGEALNELSTVKESEKQAKAEIASLMQLAIDEANRRGVYEICFSKIISAKADGKIPDAASLFEALEKEYCKWVNANDVSSPYMHPNSDGDTEYIKKVDYAEYA